MPISRDEFTDTYPSLFHISLAQELEQVRRHGLLSTSALLDTCEIEGDKRFRIESLPRPRTITISHPVHGEFLINDQAPMNAAALQTCLVDLSPEQWCKALNGRVFFWPTHRRLAKHLGARLGAGLSRTIFTFKTRSLLDVLDFDSFEFSAINSGNTMRKAARRGSATFLSPGDYPFQERRKHRGVGDAIAEVTYPYAITPSQLAAIEIEVTSEIVPG